MTYARISITLPKNVLAAADKRARELDRPRSWVVAEAVRAYLGSALAGGPSPGRVSEASEIVYAAREVAEARARHLAADLRLSPTERLRQAEQLAHLAKLVRPRGRRHQIIGFDNYEDFYEWKKGRRAGA